jgi:hypothetical protein
VLRRISNTIHVFLVLFLLGITIGGHAQKKSPKLAYSFFVAGHVYGAPSDTNLGIYPAFKAKFDYINAQPNMKFGVFTGDIVRHPKAENWDAVDADIKLLNVPVYFAPGNHDASGGKLYKSRYPTSFQTFDAAHFKKKNWLDRMVILNPLRKGWSISGQQLEMFAKPLPKKAEQKNLFVFAHQLIWWTPENNFRYMYPNSADGLQLPTNYWSTVEPMLQKSDAENVFLFAGDVGANSHFNSINYHRVGKIHYIAQGMGGRYRDNFIIVDVYQDGSVKTRLIPLKSNPENTLGNVSDYSFLPVDEVADKSYINKGREIALFDMEDSIPPGPQYSADSLLRYSVPAYRTTAAALSGTYSLLLDSMYHFGLTVRSKKFKPGERYRISVWKRGQGGALVASAILDGYKFYQKQAQPLGWTKNQWQQLSMEFVVPTEIPDGEVTMYFMNNGKQQVIFDDFKIEKIESFERSPVPLPSAVSLLLDNDAMKQLHKTRERALKAGVLIRKKKDWVNGKLIDQKDTTAIKLRLKGDWLDHLAADKWSFRIKTKNGEKAYGQSSVFNFQTPSARAFLKEWVFHLLLEQEGILTTKYGFFPLSLNGKNLGTYAYEEHFGPDLLERNNRPETPILKFEEDGFWQLQRYNSKKAQKDHVQEKHYPLLEAAEILPFQDQSVLKDSLQYAYFLKGREKLNALRYHTAPVSELVDLDKWARFLALCDLTGSYHGLAWHNMRYYYNPTTQLLEPIAYDGNPSETDYKGFSPFIKKLNKDTVALYERGQWMDYSLFNDATFLSKYLNYLEQFSEPSYLDQFFQQYQHDLYKFQSAIRYEFSNYYYDISKIYARAKNFTEWMQYKEQILKKSAVFKHQHQLDWYKEHPETPEKYLPKPKPATPFPNLSLTAYVQEEGIDSVQIMVYNYHHTSLQLTRALSGKTILQMLTDSIPKFHYKKGPGKLLISVPKACKKLEFRQVESPDKKHKIKVYPWPANEVPIED